MKKFSVIVLAIALVMMMSVPFCASADAVVAITIPDVEVEIGEDAKVVISYETAEWLFDGTFEITYPADKLELILDESSRNPENALSPLPNKQVNAATPGEIKVVFAEPDGVSGTGNIIEMPFKVLDGAAGDEYEITFVATRLVMDDGTVQGANLVTDEENFATTGKVVVKAAATTTTPAPTTTTAATTTTTAATTTTTAAPTTTTTKAASATGEATPWALLATVTVAGAALVVLSTKKSK